MKFKVGDTVLIVDSNSASKDLVGIPITIKSIEGHSYYFTDPGTVQGYLFQEGSAWCRMALKVNHYKSKLGKVLYGKRHQEM